jgi:hypothetical protein
MVRRAGAFHNPADRPAAPNHLIVVGVIIAADHGGAQGDRFGIVGHSRIEARAGGLSNTLPHRFKKV